MNWKLWLIGLAIVGAVGILGWLGWAPSGEPLFELTILHTNDVHAHYVTPSAPGERGGAARLSTAVESVRQLRDNVLLLDAGDQFQGTLLFTVGGADVVADVMNALGYDAMCLGNHEFDAGPTELLRFIQQASFPVLSANTDVVADPHLSGRVLPYALYTFERRTVAVFGLTTEQTAMTSSPGPTVQFLDVIHTADQTVQHLRSQGIDVVIALTHIGHAQDMALAATVRGIDVIVGGHSHTLLEEYPAVVLSPDGSPVLIVTAHEGGKYLGRLDLAVTRDGVLAGYDGQLITLDASVAEDPVMIERLSAYDQALADLMMSIVGAADVPLDGDRERTRSHETNLANLICDAMLWKTRTLGTTVALQNGGGIRASIPRGMITMAHVLDVLPYGNQITVLPLRGEQLVSALEHGVAAVEHGSGQFLHVSGVRYAYDPTADAGARIRSVETWNPLTSRFEPVDPMEIVAVATNAFLAGGGDGFDMLAEAASQPEAYATGWLLSDALAEYLDHHAPVAPSIEGRIAVIDNGSP